jgi:hypothetical protein
LPLKPFSRGFQLSARVSMLTEADAVEFICTQCQTHRMVAPYVLLPRFRASALLDAAAIRFKCRAWGSRGGRWAVYRATPMLQDTNEIEG